MPQPNAAHPDKLKIGIVVGSTRANRFADVPTRWIKELADRHDGIEAEIVDLRDFPLPFFDEPASPAWAPSQNEVAQAWQRKIDGLDGFIFIAAEYNHGPTAVLKNAIDYAFNEWAKKPVTFVGYGGVGGARAVEQLRLHAVEVQMAPTRVAVHILWPDYMAVQGGKPLGEMDHLNQSAAQVLDQLAWWGRALKTAREADRSAQAKAA